MAPSLCSLSLIVYIIGSGQVNDLLGGNKNYKTLVCISKNIENTDQHVQ